MSQSEAPHFGSPNLHICNGLLVIAPNFLSSRIVLLDDGEELDHRTNEAPVFLLKAQQVARVIEQHLDAVGHAYLG